jgi:hypothetical protein
MVVCLIDKNFSHEALFEQMQNTLNPVGEITLHVVGDNKIVVQCFLRDWEKVMERGPHLFRGWALIIEPYYVFSVLIQ